MPQVKAGKTRALAVTTAKRSAALRDAPTRSETILPGFDVGMWFGVLAPAGTPPAVIDKIHAEIDQMVKAPDIRKQFLERGAEPVGNTPAQMAAQIKSELTSYEALAKQIKLVVD